MQVIWFVLCISTFLYALFYESRLLCLQLTILGTYILLSTFYYPGNFGSIRKRVANSLWSAPSEGLIHSRLEIDVTKVQEYLKTQKAKDAHVTLTHICIKSVAVILDVGRKHMNGKIAFGKFIPFDTVDVSCLVNVGDGDDLASVLVTDADKKSFEEIARFINTKGQIAKKGQDNEHKARVGPLAFLPPFLIEILIEITCFLTYNLGLSVKPIGLKKHSFGAATVTSLGAFGFKDVFVPLTPMMRSCMILAINQVVNKPIVKDNQIVIAPIITLNFTLDHRFVDGGGALKAYRAFEEVFQNPEKYSF